MTQERNERDARIIKRAAEIWSEEGGLMNRHEAQWLTAMRQIDEEDRGCRASTDRTTPAGIRDPENQMHRDILEQSAPTAVDDETPSSTSVPSGIRAATRATRWLFARR